jgi:ubiquinone/menaquinone biosynthesis C-methylase UbiE
MSNNATVRQCKKIRDRIYDREQFAESIFRREVLMLVSPESTLVDVGCGRKAKFLRSLSSHVKKAYGIDLEISETVVEGKVQIMYGDAEALPLPNRSTDLITMYDVVEHFRDPKRVFLECKRILKPGGALVLVTTCKFYPPILLGRALPHCIRRWANPIISGTKKEDTFPAYYKANSARALRRLSTSVGLNVVSIKHLTYHPEYYMFSTLFYRCAVAVERFVLQREIFTHLRHHILCQLRRPVEMQYDSCA